MATRQRVTTIERPGRYELEGGVPVWKEGPHPCSEGCGGGHPVPRDATGTSCEHGAWQFDEPDAPAPTAETPTPDPRDAELAQLREDLAAAKREAEAAKQAAAQGGDAKDKADGKAPAKDDKPPAK